MALRLLASISLKVTTFVFWLAVTETHDVKDEFNVCYCRLTQYRDSDYNVMLGLMSWKRNSPSCQKICLLLIVMLQGDRLTEVNYY